MGTELRVLTTSTKEQELSVARALEKAGKAELTCFILVGLDKAGDICTFSSSFPSRLALVGALEFAKYEIINPK